MIDQNTVSLFDIIYEQTYKDISKYVVCHCENIDDVQDILQNIYFEVLKKINKVDISNYSTYTLGIAKNKVKDYYRFKYKTKLLSLYIKINDINELIETISDDVDIPRNINIQCEIEKVWDYLKKKPVIVSKIFYLYFYIGLTLEEISNELHISQSQVKNYLYRTLKELRVIL